jgi:signal transduction histidine kinase
VLLLLVSYSHTYFTRVILYTTHNTILYCSTVATAVLFTLWCACSWTLAYTVLRANKLCIILSLSENGDIETISEEARIKEQRDKERSRTHTMYVANTLHDIGTPLATFSLGLDILFSSPLVSSLEYRDVLETMKTARDMMTLTRKKAMDYFRAQAG